MTLIFIFIIMAITAKRFKFLDQETNIPIFDFLKVNFNDILNSGLSELIQNKDTILKSIFGQLNLDSLGVNLKDLPIDELEKFTKDIRSTVDGLSNMISKSGLSSDIIDTIGSQFTSAFSSDKSLNFIFSDEKIKKDVLTLATVNYKKQQRKNNKTNTDFCKGSTLQDKNAIIDLLGNLLGINLNTDTNALKNAILSSIIKRGACAGIGNIFELTKDSVASDLDRLAISNDAINHAVNVKNSALALNVAANQPNKQLSKLVKNLPNKVSKSLANKNIPKKNLVNTFNNLNNSLNTSSSNWLTQNGAINQSLNPNANIVNSVNAASLNQTAFNGVNNTNYLALALT